MMQEEWVDVSAGKEGLDKDTFIGEHNIDLFSVDVPPTSTIQQAVGRI